MSDTVVPCWCAVAASWVRRVSDTRSVRRWLAMGADLSGERMCLTDNTPPPWTTQGCCPSDRADRGEVPTPPRTGLPLCGAGRPSCPRGGPLGCLTRAPPAGAVPWRDRPSLLGAPRRAELPVGLGAGHGRRGWRPLGSSSTASALARVHSVLYDAREWREDEGARCDEGMKATGGARCQRCEGWHSLASSCRARSGGISMRDSLPPEVSWGAPCARAVRRPPERDGHVVALNLEARIVE